jgi:hypothetical protein
MKEVKDFEERVWELISNATQNRDSSSIRELTEIAEEIKQIKEQAKKISAAIKKLGDKLEKLGISPTMAQSTNSISWKVSTADIRQGIVSIKEPRKAGLIPTDGTKFVVQTSLGQIFQTAVNLRENRLTEKEKINEFYQEEQIKPGSKLVWTEIAPLKYSLEKGE